MSKNGLTICDKNNIYVYVDTDIQHRLLLNQPNDYILTG